MITPETVTPEQVTLRIVTPEPVTLRLVRTGPDTAERVSFCLVTYDQVPLWLIIREAGPVYPDSFRGSTPNWVQSGLGTEKKTTAHQLPSSIS